jgi:hypothetical protein
MDAGVINKIARYKADADEAREKIAAYQERLDHAMDKIDSILKFEKAKIRKERMENHESDI